jgi:hypothetical protein
MKILRSVTRRGFSVGTAGYFAVLKPNTWFPATRLPVPFRYRSNPSTQALTETTAPNIITLRAEHRPALRQALILVVSAAMVLGMLWWMMYEGTRHLLSR